MEAIEGPSEIPLPVKKPKGKSGIGTVEGHSEEAVRAEIMGRTNGHVSESSDEDEDVFSRLRNLDAENEERNSGWLILAYFPGKLLKRILPVFNCLEFVFRFYYYHFSRFRR